MSRQQEGHNLEVKKLAFTKHWIFLQLHNLSASRTVRNKYLLFKHPSLWYLVIATQTDQNKSSRKQIIGMKV